jgi:hypothetical protein
MGRVDTGLGVFGVLATLLGVGLLFAPGLLRTGPVTDLTTAVAETGSTQLLLVLGFLTALLVGVAAWPGSTAPDEAGTPAFPPPGDHHPATDGGGDAVLGADIEAAVREGGSAWRQARAMLADTAVSAYAQREGVSQSNAAEAIEQGRWTDDPLAAGVVGNEVPRRARLRLWLAPERERRRRIERTTAAIERLQHR